MLRSRLRLEKAGTRLWPELHRANNKMSPVTYKLISVNTWLRHYPVVFTCYHIASIEASNKKQEEMVGRYIN